MKLRARLATGATVAVNATGQTGDTLHQIQLSTIAASLAGSISAADYESAGAPYALSASSSDATISIHTVQGGYDANFIRLYTTSSSERLTA